MIQKLKTLSKQSHKVLPNNRIQNEVKEIVRSFNIPLGILLSSKYEVHNNHIYPNQNKWLFLLSICRMLFFNSMSLYRLYTGLSRGIYPKASVDSDDVVYNFLLIVFTLIHTFSFTILFILEIVHKQNNVDLILKIQTIHKSIDFSKSFPTYIIWNWISIFFTFFADISVTVAFYSPLHRMNTVIYLFQIFTDMSFFAFDINFMIATRVIVLLRKYLEKWIDDVLMMDDEEDHDEQCQQLLETYQYILETYSLYKNIFQALVS